MTDKYRQERIERLLNELKYEITRGMMEREVDETLGFEFYVPISHAIPEGMVFCSFRTRPIHRHNMYLTELTPRLKIVGNDEKAKA